MPANLPDADALVLEVIRARIPDGDFGTQIPDDLNERIKTKAFTTIRRVGGSVIDYRGIDRALVHTSSWATARADAYAAAAAVRSALYDAWNQQGTYVSGHIAAIAETSAPAEVRTGAQDDNVWRFDATYSLALRPAPTA